MKPDDAINTRLAAIVRPVLTSPVVRWLALLGLCAAYLQGGFNKAVDFPSAIAEMNHFGLSPAAPFAVAAVVAFVLACAVS